MKFSNYKRITIFGVLSILIVSSCISAYGEKITNSVGIKNAHNFSDVKYIEYNLTFSELEIEKYGNYWVVRVKETNHNRWVLFDLNPGKPVLPVNISNYSIMFGSKILDVSYDHPNPETINLTSQLAYCKASHDVFKGQREIPKDKEIYENSEPYPENWITYHTGGGLYREEYKTFFVIRVYPVRYFPIDNQLQFISNITVNVSYIEPDKPLINDNDINDLLIIAPRDFNNQLKPLVKHKEKYGLKTKVVSTDFIYQNMNNGRDQAEKIKYFIKQEIEDSGIKYVLLVGGRKGQSLNWYIPVRFSRVVPPDEQEYAEQMFISDLYYSDIYDGEGLFSSWDSDNDDLFSVWNSTVKDDFDLYPDVYVGRLACRYNFEVKIMVDKIINYESSNVGSETWFKNLLLVAGDSYNDTAHYNEGELISEEAIRIMPGFNPIKVYARIGEDITGKRVNNEMKKGSGFAYFCGHGSAGSWSTHFPPDGKVWTDGYEFYDMISLRNKEKLPVVVVGGCHNGQFDVTVLNAFNKNAGYYSWIPRCWAWWLTTKFGGGAIATIANTGLGTHGDGDLDNNSIPDYLEILDGWLELKLLELSSTYENDFLGDNIAETFIGYFNRFLGDYAKMDVKMVQQWQLFGDPSLKLGGYQY
jgi:hypothetical protein